MATSCLNALGQLGLTRSAKDPPPPRTIAKDPGLGTNALESNKNLLHQNAENTRIILWNFLNQATQGLNFLLVQPDDDIVYNQALQALNSARLQLGYLNAINTYPNELEKINLSLISLNKKAIEVEKLRKKLNKGDQSLPDSTGNENSLSRQSFQLSEVLKQAQENGLKLDGNILNLIKANDQTKKELINSLNVFDSISNADFGLEKKKIEDKTIDFVPPEGLGYSKTIYDDSALTLSYSIERINLKKCFYTSSRGSTIISSVSGSQVKILNDSVPFAAYYYRGICKLTNKLGKKLLINGFIFGDSHFDSKKHISCVGDVATCLSEGTDFARSCPNIFYYSWYFILSTSISETATFWTEIPSEEPSFKISYKIIN